jgi:imidazolonepropionase-like amidohydrolase
MHRGGVELLAGTDSPLDYGVPGFRLHTELELLTGAGLTPMEALQTATYNPAKFFGKLDSQGTVERGKLADVVLLDADPLDDIRNTRKIHLVIAQGKLFRRPALDAALRAAEGNAQN